ncbi:hypothetical protein SORBI_3006G169300 [Sorghum bicolor]|uniref:Uncharacterized protein n=1 Tax=Sorghum bicolor TaxID=4558 RepID=A0A1B6PME3_SORBI|nr:hypothetical protein SORBI_3006G169300 [Sorghum bicolor]
MSFRRCIYGKILIRSAVFAIFGGCICTPYLQHSFAPGGSGGLVVVCTVYCAGSRTVEVGGWAEREMHQSPWPPACGKRRLVVGLMHGPYWQTTTTEGLIMDYSAQPRLAQPK